MGVFFLLVGFFLFCLGPLLFTSCQENFLVALIEVLYEFFKTFFSLTKFCVWICCQKNECRVAVLCVNSCYKKDVECTLLTILSNVANSVFCSLGNVMPWLLPVKEQNVGIQASEGRNKSFFSSHLHHHSQPHWFFFWHLFFCCSIHNEKVEWAVGSIVQGWNPEFTSFNSRWY